MQFVRSLLEQLPMMALFLTIAIGYLLGEVSIKGFSLGVGAVLFVALAVGWFAPKAAPPPMLGVLGLALFLYGIGIHYGSEFFRGLVSREGRQANLLAIIGVLCSAAASLAFAGGKVTLGHAIGLFVGAGTSSAALQAGIQAFGNNDPAVGYSVAYPFGVALPIFFLYVVFRRRKPRVEGASTAGQMLEIAIRHPEIAGKSVGDVATMMPAGTTIVAVREGGHNEPASPDLILHENDVVLAVGQTRDALEQARTLLGDAAAGRIADDRRDLDYLRVFASKAVVVGRRLADLALPAGLRCSVVHVRRGDTDLLARPDLVLEYGDRVGLLANRVEFPAVRKFFGDSIKSTAEFSYISIGLAMALGFLVGAIRLPVPGVGTISIGLAGVLLVALVLGRRRRTGGITWTIPLSANLVLRNLGLTLFLAQVGLSSGPRFAATVAETGFLFLGLAATTTIALALPVLILGLYVFDMPFDKLAGIVAGACGNPAILAYANKATPTDKPDTFYAMIFPGMTILKILIADVAPALFGR